MKRRGISILLILCLVFTFSVAGVTYGATQSEIQGDIDQNNQDLAEVRSDLQKVKADIDELQPKVDAAEAEVKAAGAKVAEIEAKITQKQKEIEEREDGLNARLRVMYKNGSVGYVDILLNSGSISELISNLEMIQMIYKSDMDTIDTLEKEQEELAEIEKELKAEKASLDKKKADLDSQMSELNSLKAELEKAEDEFLAEGDRLAAELKELINPGSEYVGGTYVWPAPSTKYVTSMFGWRIHPVYNKWKYHNGTDIAGNSGSSILACASGTVIMSQVYGGYGECIVIDHGGGITSLYGHMQKNSRKVKVGDKVTAGQLIGLMGSTGTSTGPHLHLEFTVNGKLVDALEYIPTDGIIYLC